MAITRSSFGGFSGSSGKMIPPPGTSARKAYEKSMNQGTAAPKTIQERLTGTFDYPAKPFISKVVDTLTSNSSTKKKRSFHSRSSSGSSGGYSGSSGGYSGSPVSAQEAFHYYEAPIAKTYGLSPTTAYQEALANTSYRREMEDMRKAGLNPSVIYGSHNTSGADSSVIPRDDFAPVSYGGRSGGSGGYSRRSRGGNSGKYVLAIGAS